MSRTLSTYERQMLAKLFDAVHALNRDYQKPGSDPDKFKALMIFRMRRINTAHANIVERFKSDEIRNRAIGILHLLPKEYR
jgi:hypothetical protein